MIRPIQGYDFQQGTICLVRSVDRDPKHTRRGPWTARASSPGKTRRGGRGTPEPEPSRNTPHTPRGTPRTMPGFALPAPLSLTALVICHTTIPCMVRHGPPCGRRYQDAMSGGQRNAQGSMETPGTGEGGRGSTSRGVSSISSSDRGGAPREEVSSGSPGPPDVLPTPNCTECAIGPRTSLTFSSPRPQEVDHYTQPAARAMPSRSPGTLQ